MPRDAEQWLAERGIEREPIIVHPFNESVEAPSQATPDQPTSDQPTSDQPTSDQPTSDQPTSSPQTGSSGEGPGSAGVPESPSGDDDDASVSADDVAEALSFIRRSVSVAPQSEGRLAGKLVDRGTDPDVVDRALARARAQGLVDDEAMVGALIEERRAKGHAVSRIRRDLVERGFERDLVEVALAPVAAQDPEAMAFDVAKTRADQLSTLDASAAFRRVTAYVARRGYPDGLARKVARAAVFASREDDRIIGH